MPAKVEKKVASRMGTNISVGWVAPSCARYTMKLTAWNNRVDEGFAEGKPMRAAASLDDKDWESMNFPGEVGPQLAGFDGVMWVRKEIEIPASWAGKDVQLFGGLLMIMINLPTSLYNAMIHPLVPYSIRGAIWYQGKTMLPCLSVS